ncbi:bifunctional metallophosphatase/5'-nucleotidase [Neobacillus ginsengisoli]|uniref:2',3'-cyclic-nucleotide 2'-phosphodiesterase (5'-nucleotidase family) n=1 Tax=Neobacillus ginsengisoli TaxID=904295 RepID=A0ABT9XTI8_9BACI|nr:bifunctional UDP-sugar hydrolase/5'-nucleotidase [Neobacillus ginsengisoli]MDQ0198874.1 2',3'-cyclic-nucleotide 2'-phosphodiesterase (5'-nucleotidase family) [Neobacillus ginsengisoli]
MESIHIYHTNDIHSHLERWPRIHDFLLERKKMHQKKGEDVFLFDIGDFIDRWHPFSEGTKGLGNIDLLNECGFSAVTIGNNEGINLSFEDLNQLYDNAQFDVLVANLYQKGKIHPLWLKPFEIYRTGSGTRMAVIGLTAPFSHLYELLGWQLTDPFLELKEWINLLKENTDIIILLSHLGIKEDERIAEEFPEIDVILGGHTHHVLQEGKLVNNTILCAAGNYGNYVGHVTLQVDQHKKLESKKAILYDVNKLPVTKDEQERTEAFILNGKKRLTQKVISLREPLVSDPLKETKLAVLLCKALREWCKADCALINAGLLLGPLTGDVTAYDLLSICPHPINPCKIKLTGQELKDILLISKNVEWPNRQIKGLGFRGTVMGIMIYDQIIFKDDLILVNGSELDLERNYTLALPDMFTFGFFFPDLLQSQHKEYFLPEFLRDILKWKLQKQF